MHCDEVQLASVQKFVVVEYFQVNTNSSITKL